MNSHLELSEICYSRNQHLQILDLPTPRCSYHPKLLPAVLPRHQIAICNRLCPSSLNEVTPSREVELRLACSHGPPSSTTQCQLPYQTDDGHLFGYQDVDVQQKERGILLSIPIGPAGLAKLRVPCSHGPPSSTI